MAGELALLLLMPVLTLAADAPARLDPHWSKFVAQHCLRCHGPDKSEGELRLDQLATDFDDGRTFDRWRSITERLKKGDMPPPDEPRPEPAHVTAAITQIEQQLSAAAARSRAAGRVVLRRMNRVQYEQTVRDLFAVEIGVKEMLPEDTISQGFDTLGAALNISPVQMERYLEAADAVLSAATAPLKTAPQTTARFKLLDSLPQWFLASVYAQPDGVILYRNDGTPTFVSKFRPPVPGRYHVRVAAQAHQSPTPITMGVLAGHFNAANATARHVGYYDVIPGGSQVIDFETRLESMYETIKVMPMALPRVYVNQKNMSEYPGAGLLIEWIEIDGPLPEASPAESYRRVFGEIDPAKGTAADAELRLKQFLPRAFRRPIDESEVLPYRQLFEQSLATGETFEQALCGAFKAVLCSPQFLYLREQPGQLDDHALASRLSYFLWSTMPDDRLLAQAAKGDLRQPTILRAEVARMLDHPKSQQFISDFVGQWLSLRDISFTTPDKVLYPEYEEYLQWSMVQETQRFITELLTHDLSVLNIVDSDFALLNERLAKHYGIEGVVGGEFRKVALKPEQHRGGVLTHASILKVTANGTNTSPVVRGVWLLDRILGTPVPPPPANVPAIEPDIRGAVTIREQLFKHRQLGACATCHTAIDPPGFALENYDVIGGWRERYRLAGTKEKVRVLESPIYRYLAKPQYGFGLPVEAGDVLADGRPFADLTEFKRLLLANPDQITRSLVEKLIVYGTGHRLEYGDRVEVERIVTGARQSKYGFRSLIHAVVASDLFRHK